MYSRHAMGTFYKLGIKNTSMLISTKMTALLMITATL